MSNLEFFSNGDGLRIEVQPQMVEFGLTWDGAERMTFRMDAKQLLEVVEAALNFLPTRPCPLPHHPTMERPWGYDDSVATGEA